MKQRHLHRSNCTSLSKRTQQKSASCAIRPLAAATLMGGLSIMPLAATAATIVVNSTTDPGNASTCTLRQAIVSMNTGAISGNCANSGATFGSNDTIEFADALFSAASLTITLADKPEGQLRMLSATGTDLTIDAGAGRNATVQRAAGAQNPFPVIVAYATSGYGHGGTVTLRGITVQNGVASYIATLKYPTNAGGGITDFGVNLTLDRCVVRNNEAAHSPYGQSLGGGVVVQAGSLSLRSSVVSGNHADSGSGVAGINSPIYIIDSTLEGNGGLPGGGDPQGAIVANSSLSIINSTLSGNTGPAISTSYSFSITNSTIACNSGGAVAALVPGLKLTAISTIFADTTNSLCATMASTEIDNNWTVSGDHNLIVSGSAAFPADTITGDPLLGTLQNNGGTTPTHALGVGSPAQDQGSNPNGELSADQRGDPFGRSLGSAPDIGAYENQTSHQCGAADSRSFASLSSSTPNLCSSGAYLQGGPFGSGPWSWFCAANAAPHPNEFCGARVLASASLVIDNAGGTPISSAVFGQPLLLKAVVGSGSSTPTGTVTFADVTGGGFIPVCVNAALSGGETACDTTNRPIAVGSRQLNAVYNGDGTFGAATSSPGTIQITTAASTTSVLDQTPNPVAAGSTFTVVAHVTANAPSVAAPRGAVLITDQTDGLACAYDLAAPTPGCALTPVSVGTHNLVVAYQGNANMAGSSAMTTEPVALPPVTLTVADGLQYARYGQTLTYELALKNLAAGKVSGIAINGAPNANLAGATLTWQCVPGAGASCASGSGATFADTAALPAGTTLTWTVSVTVPSNASGDSIAFSTSVGSTTRTDTDTLVIFRDGFGN